MNTYKSPYFDDVQDLIGEKDNLLLHTKERRAKVDAVRAFTNGMTTLTEEEAKDSNRTEITNHMFGYRNIQQVETQYNSIYTESNTLLEVQVDTDNPELDYKLSTIITTRLNQAIYDKGRFGNLWRSVSGELPIAAVAALMFDNAQGWCPKLQTNMLFPKGTGFLASECTYAFAPRELTMADLRKLSNSVKGENSRYIDKVTIDGLIDSLKEQIRTNSVGVSNVDEDEFEIAPSVEEKDSITKERKTTLNAWLCFEVHQDGKEEVVSMTMFTEAMQIGKNSVESAIIAHRPKAFNSPDAWLHFIVADSEIGGVATIEKAKGIAQLTYNSDSNREELFNYFIEGAKERAKPKYTVETTADIDDVLMWNPKEDPFAPEGVSEFQMRAPSGDLFTPFEILGQNSASLSAGGFSNSGRGGESRNQTLERQSNTGVIKNSRMSEVYQNVDMLFAQILDRFFNAESPVGTDGWEDIHWFRGEMDRELKEKLGVDWKKLATRKFSRFTFLKVKAVRSIGEGDRTHQIDISSWLMENLPAFQPQVRPHIIHRATQTVTKDPDLADFLVRKPEILLSSQKVVAENEYDTILRRASLGELISTNVDDIHQDHLTVHLKDLQAHLSRHQVAPWNRADVLGFAGMVEHIGEHLQILLGNKDTVEEGKVFSQALQQVVQAAAAVVDEVNEAEGSEANQLTDKERADIELKTMDLQLKAQKLGLDMEAHKELVKSRNARQAIISRGSYSREIFEAKRLQLQDKQTDDTNAKK